MMSIVRIVCFLLLAWLLVEFDPVVRAQGFGQQQELDAEERSLVEESLSEVLSWSVCRRLAGGSGGAGLTCGTRANDGGARDACAVSWSYVPRPEIQSVIHFDRETRATLGATARLKITQVAANIQFT